MRAGVCARWHVLKACACVHVAPVFQERARLTRKDVLGTGLALVAAAVVLYILSGMAQVYIAPTLPATLYCYFVQAWLRCAVSLLALHLCVQQCALLNAKNDCAVVLCCDDARRGGKGHARRDLLDC